MNNFMAKNNPLTCCLPVLRCVMSYTGQEERMLLLHHRQIMADNPSVCNAGEP